MSFLLSLTPTSSLSLTPFFIVILILPSRFSIINFYCRFSQVQRGRFQNENGFYLLFILSAIGLWFGFSLSLCLSLSLSLSLSLFLSLSLSLFASHHSLSSPH